MRTKTALKLGLWCGLLILSSCATHDSANPPSANLSTSSDREATDLTEKENIEVDADLYTGDLGVEKLIYAYRVRSFVDAPTPLVDPHGFPLVEKKPNPLIVPIRGSYAENVIKTAESYLGVPYVYGSDRTDPSSFDCSDFTRWIFLASLGMDLPWDSRSQAAYVRAFSDTAYTTLQSAKRGDLLFFTSYRGNRASDYAGLKPSEKPISHVALYLGNGKIIHCASKRSGGVRMDTLNWRQLNNRFLFGGGILP